VDLQKKLEQDSNSAIRSELEMLPSVNYDLTGCQKQPSPDHVVWGGVRRPTAASILPLGLRLVVLGTSWHAAWRWPAPTCPATS